MSQNQGAVIQLAGDCYFQQVTVNNIYQVAGNCYYREPPGPAPDNFIQQFVTTPILVQ